MRYELARPRSAGVTPATPVIKEPNGNSLSRRERELIKFRTLSDQLRNLYLQFVLVSRNGSLWGLVIHEKKNLLRKGQKSDL